MVKTITKAKKTGVAVTPRISVNKLGEYLEAAAGRRKEIVKDTKYPPAFKAVRYSDARDAIKAHLCNDLDSDIIHDAIAFIKGKPDSSDFWEQDNRLSIELLEKVLTNGYDWISPFEVGAFGMKNPLMNICGVDVSVYPDLILAKEFKGVRHLGAVKFSILKNKEFEEETLSIIAMLTHKYVNDHIALPGQIANRKMCFSHDVFNDRCERAPDAVKLRMKRVEAACEEIKLWWDTL